MLFLLLGMLFPIIPHMLISLASRSSSKGHHPTVVYIYVLVYFYNTFYNLCVCMCVYSLFFITFSLKCKPPRAWIKSMSFPFVYPVPKKVSDKSNHLITISWWIKWIKEPIMYDSVPFKYLLGTNFLQGTLHTQNTFSTQFSLRPWWGGKIIIPTL